MIISVGPNERNQQILTRESDTVNGMWYRQGNVVLSTKSETAKAILMLSCKWNIM